MRFCSVLVFLLWITLGVVGFASNKKAILVNWFEPEISEIQDEKAEVKISGETMPRATVSVDLSKIISISGGGGKRPTKSEIRSTRADERGIFELEISMDFGILQVPVQIQQGKEASQNLLVIFEVASNAVKINAKTIKRPKARPVKETPAPEILEEIKPKAERERDRARNKSEAGESSIDLFLGVAYPSHKYSQRISSESDVSFQSGNAPSLNFSLGGKMGAITIDGGFSSSTGSIAAAAAPFVIKKGDYKWQSMGLSVGYLFGDKPSRSGPGSEIKLGYGTRSQPFLSIDSVTKDVYAVGITQSDLIVGFEYRFGQVTDWLSEIGLSYHAPSSASSEKGTYNLKSGSAIEGNLSVKKSVAETYILSAFVNVTSNQSTFDYQETPSSTSLTGTSSFLVTEVGASVGFSF